MRRYRERVRDGRHVTRPLALPDIDLTFRLVELGFLADEDAEDKLRIDDALERWIVELVTP